MSGISLDRPSDITGDKIQIEGPSGNIAEVDASNQLKITAPITGITVDNIPGRDTVPFTMALENGGSDDMTVDGSTTPVVFSVGPGSGEVWYTTRITMVINDTGTMDATDFGAEPTLTNGVDVEFYINSSVTNFYTFTQNYEMAMVFAQGNFVGVSAGFLDDKNLFTGTYIFAYEVKLDGDAGDLIRVRINDNLTGVDLLRMQANFWKELT